MISFALYGLAVYHSETIVQEIINQFPFLAKKLIKLFYEAKEIKSSKEIDFGDDNEDEIVSG